MKKHTRKLTVNRESIRVLMSKDLHSPWGGIPLNTDACHTVPPTCDTGDCQHERTKRGKNAPRVYGSYRTEVCTACGAFRMRDHLDELYNEWVSRWRPAEEYADAIAKDDDY